MSTIIILLCTLGRLDQDFERANALYEAGRFDSALALYDSIVERSPSPEVYYNRGNTNFKLGRIGYALADYLRAYALAPHDPDVQTNIAFLRQMCAGPDRPVALSSPFARVLRWFFTIFDPVTCRVLAGLTFFVACLGFALFLVFGRRWLLGAGCGLLVVFAYFGGATVYWRNTVNPSRAVVVVPEAVLRSGPGAEYKELALVRDGVEVRIVEQRPGYLLVQMPGGVGGWVEERALERVFR